MGDTHVLSIVKRVNSGKEQRKLVGIGTTTKIVAPEVEAFPVRVIPLETFFEGNVIHKQQRTDWESTMVKPKKDFGRKIRTKSRNSG